MNTRYLGITPTLLRTGVEKRISKKTMITMDFLEIKMRKQSSATLVI